MQRNCAHQIFRTNFRLFVRQSFHVIQRHVTANFKFLITHGEDIDWDCCRVLDDDCAMPVVFEEV